MAGADGLNSELHSDKRISHAGDVLVTIYLAFGIDPDTIVYNRLNQPRELVQARR